MVCGFLTYRGYHRAIRHEYEKDLSGTIRFVSERTNVDDLENCVNSGTRSEAYRDLQVVLDSIVDTMDILYVYILIPLNETGVDSAQTVIASYSADEYAAGSVEPVLNVLSGTDCPKDAAINNMKAFLSNEITFFRTDSVWGHQYTAGLPLFNSAGERFALLCADVGIDSIHRQALRGAISTVAPIVLIGFVFWLVFSYLVDRNITLPIKKLQERAQEFAAICDHKHAPESLVFGRLDIHTENEVESLSDAITHMAQSIRAYAEEIRTAEDRTMMMTRLAYRDSLTHVSNATAYEEEKLRLENEISNGGAEFALVIIDVNDLKQINDTYGHEFGDEYILGVSRIFCDVFRHSLVFRIGGDEFVAIVQDRDYRTRDELLLILRQTFAQTSMDEDVMPWYRYSAAAGMAAYKQGDTVRDVFHRADEAMYKSKLLMKQ